MGRVFECIADDALHASGGDQCHLCERTDIPVYDYTGEIINPALAANPQLAKDEPKVSWLCADCINGGNVMRTDTWAVANTVAQFAANRRLPGAPSTPCRAFPCSSKESWIGHCAAVSGVSSRAIHQTFGS